MDLKEWEEVGAPRWIEAREELVDSVRAERDAALAAIARVHAAVESAKHWNEGCGWDVPSIKVLQALASDGGDDG
ncbi:hypothetical protein G7068_16055 [Leucobacter viscericola]|uniref:Uncharacterized protein n=1 Tax=Leucobacter viscericola TaxID=2714935 RepID=A0A6G7XIY5_9MICO|nr:hypothetical protein [Leucobacter viscericola]QIK64560.1 hypothetical protein G7068_16055 [Leucobacter viscericola]